MKFLIAHAAWRKDRRAALGRLIAQLDPCGDVRVDIIESQGREHAAIWSRRVWETAAENGEHVCILNDDVVLLPGFHARIAALVAAVPDEPLSLHCTNPLAVPLAAQGHAWVRAYHYTGPAVVLPPGAAADLCRFVYDLPWSFLSRTNEDNVANLWAWTRQRPFWYALPAPVTHDTTVPSTLGYDGHPNRVPTVLDGPVPDPTVTDRWAVPFVELSWAPTAMLERTRRVLRAGGEICAWCLGSSGETRGIGKAGTLVCISCLLAGSAFAMEEA